MARWETHRSDENQEAIVAAWRRVGASVWLIGRPVDAIVGFQGRDYLIEIKTPRGRIRASQTAFRASWRGHEVQIVRTVDEALRAIGAMK